MASADLLVALPVGFVQTSASASVYSPSSSNGTFGYYLTTPRTLSVATTPPLTAMADRSERAGDLSNQLMALKSPALADDNEDDDVSNRYWFPAAAAQHSSHDSLPGQITVEFQYKPSVFTGAFGTVLSPKSPAVAMDTTGDSATDKSSSNNWGDARTAMTAEYKPSAYSGAFGTMLFTTAPMTDARKTQFQYKPSMFSGAFGTVLYTTQTTKSKARASVNLPAEYRPSAFTGAFGTVLYPKMKKLQTADEMMAYKPSMYSGAFGTVLFNRRAAAGGRHAMDARYKPSAFSGSFGTALYPTAAVSVMSQAVACECCLSADKRMGVELSTPSPQKMKSRAKVRPITETLPFRMSDETLFEQ